MSRENPESGEERHMRYSLENKRDEAERHFVFAFWIISVAAFLAVASWELGFTAIPIFLAAFALFFFAIAVGVFCRIRKTNRELRELKERRRGTIAGGVK